MSTVERLTQEELDWLRQQLHSPAMQCRQCEVTRRLIEEVSTT